MERQIVETTDGKYLGFIFDDTKPLVSSDGISFHPTVVQDLGNGFIRYSNSNYIVLTKEVTDG